MMGRLIKHQSKFMIMVYYFKHIIGNLQINGDIEIVDKIDQNKLLPPKDYPELLAKLKDKKFFTLFYEENLKLTKQKIRDSINGDNYIIQTISNIKELEKVNNILVKRIREWYSLYLPEVSDKIDDNERFVKEINSLTKEELIKKYNLNVDNMGLDLSSRDLNQITDLITQANSVYLLREKEINYLREVMKDYCPNLLELLGATICAQLIELAKGLKKLALLPSSTVQLLGAEKALFRHLKSGAASPKYGVIINHQYVQKSKKKGKMARMLADKISLLARIDYFHGEFKANDYKKELEDYLKNEN
jgi:nucleolar protein 56